MSQEYDERVCFAYRENKYNYYDRWEGLVYRVLLDGYSACDAKRYMSFEQFKDIIFNCTDEETIKYIVNNSISLP